MVSQAVTVTVTGVYVKARISFLKRVNGRFSESVSYFLEASRNFIVTLLHKKQPKFVKTIELKYKKY